MEYLLAFLGLGVLCVCALGAYGSLDAVEAEEEADGRRKAVRAERPHIEASVAAQTDRLEDRMRVLEDRFDQLVLDYVRVESARRTGAAARSETPR